MALLGRAHLLFLLGLLGACDGGAADLQPAQPLSPILAVRSLTYAKAAPVVVEPESADGRRFGSAVAVSGRTLVATRAQVAGTGVVLPFTRVDVRSPFALDATLKTTVANDAFGAGIAIAGDRISVLAPGSGCVDPYVRAGSTWSAASPICGGSSCAAGRIAAVGSLGVASGEGCTPSSSFLGVVTESLAAVDSSPLKGAPSAIAIAQNGTSSIAVVGLPLVARGGAAGAGVVQLAAVDSTGRFDFLNTGAAPDPAPSAAFGTAVAAMPGIVTAGAGTPFTILVGAPGRASGAGGLYVFDSGSSALGAPKWRGTFEAEGRFGAAIAVSGTRAVVGAPDSGGAGAVYLLERDVSSGAFAMTTKLVAPDGASGDHFGAAVAIDGDTIVVGAPDHAVMGHTSAGAVYAFDVAPVQEDGTSCDSAGMCSSGACVDGVCCATASCAAGQRCDIVGTAGVCAYPPPEVSDGGPPHVSSTVQRCNQRSDCQTGFCVDGVCCDSACTDRCSSCAIPGHEGSCGQQPAGFDLRSECGSSGTCIATCDGAHSCGPSFPGAHCRNDHCTGPSTGEGVALCKAGSCDLAASAVFDCGNYACAPAFGACLTSCTRTDDCAPGFVCDGKRQCVSAAPTDDSSGCSMGRASASSPFAWLACVGIVFAITRRRMALAALLATGCSRAQKNVELGTQRSAIAIETRLHAFDGAAGDGYGRALSLFTDGTGTPSLAIGAPLHGAGAVYVYGFDGTRWTAGDTLADASATGFGTSVGAFGSELVASSHSRATSFAPSAAPQVFGPTASSIDFGRMGVSRHVPSAFENGTVAIADLSPETTRPTGSVIRNSVSVFHNQVGVFVGPDAALTASDGDTIEGFGASIAADEEWIAVGCDPRVHALTPAVRPVYLFHGAGASTRTWASPEAQQVTLAGVLAGDLFGAAVALDSDGSSPRKYTLAIGAPARIEGGKSVGAVYVFGAVGASGFTFQAKIVLADGAEGDGFGASLALHGDSLAIGAPGRAPAGSAYLFTRTGSTWALATALTPSDGVAGDKFGSAIAVVPEGTTGTFIAVGNAPSAKPATVYVYGTSPLADGASCAAAAECVKGNCVDGVCCSTASCAEGERCDLPFSPGVCARPSVFTDAGPSESGADASDGGSDVVELPDATPPDVSTTEIPKVSGAVTSCDGAHPCSGGLFCVEGVCCDSACNDPCHSCVLPFAPGHCSPEPTGIDVRHDCAVDGSCSATCGPSGACVSSFAGAQCHKSRCTGLAKGEGPAVCAATNGACGEPIEFDCGAFACQPAIGACITVCTGSDDCNAGSVCDVSSGLCVPPPGAEADNGCAFRPRTVRDSFAAIFAAAIAVALLRRRR